MNATPRTDNYIGDSDDDCMTEGEIAMCDFSRSLEIELIAVTKQRDELAEELKNLKELAYPLIALEVTKSASSKLKP